MQISMLDRFNLPSIKPENLQDKFAEGVNSRIAYYSGLKGTASKIQKYIDEFINIKQ